MIDPNKVTQAVMEFMQNPTWKEIFMNAPGGAMERLAISFYFSKFHDDFKPEDFDEYRSLRDEYEKSMTEEDLQYLIDNSDKPAAIKHYKDLLEKLQKNGGQPTGSIRFEKGGEESSEESNNQNESQETEKVEETKEDGKEEIKGSIEKNIQEQTPNQDTQQKESEKA